MLPDIRRSNHSAGVRTYLVRFIDNFVVSLADGIISTCTKCD
jgi:hypothetical protein